MKIKFQNNARFKSSNNLKRSSAQCNFIEFEKLKVNYWLIILLKLSTLIKYRKR